MIPIVSNNEGHTVTEFNLENSFSKMNLLSVIELFSSSFKDFFFFLARNVKTLTGEVIFLLYLKLKKRLINII